MRADGAGRTVCLSVCPGANYKALEAPADGFAPAFLWVHGGREREWDCLRQGRRAPVGPSGEGRVSENCCSFRAPTPAALASILQRVK